MANRQTLPTLCVDENRCQKVTQADAVPLS